VAGRSAAAVAPATPEPRREAAARTPRGFTRTDLLLLTMTLIWGVNFSVVKYGAEVVPPLAFNGARMALASVALAAVALARSVRLSRRDLGALLLLGVLGNGVYQFLFVQGVSLTRAGNAALVLAATPAVVALLGRLRGVERIGPRAVLGIALSIAGIGIIVLSTAQGQAGDSSVRGDALMLAACVAWAVYTVLLKPYAERIDGITLSAVTMVGGTLPLLVVAIPSLVVAPWGQLSWAGWGAILYSGLGALVVAYLFYYRGVRTLGPTRTAMYANVQPVIALTVAWLTLGETPTIFQVAGAALILGGLVLTRRS